MANFLTDATFAGNITAPSFTGPSQGAVTGAPDATIWRVSGQYPTWGIFYDEATPDLIQFKASGSTNASISLDNGDYTGRNSALTGTLAVGGNATITGNLDVNGTASDIAITGGSMNFKDSNDYIRITKASSSAQFGLFRSGGGGGGMYIGGSLDGFRIYTSSFAQKFLLSQTGDGTFAGTISSGAITSSGNITLSGGGVRSIQSGGDIALKTSTGEYALYGAANGNTNLYYNGLQKFRTDPNGVVVTGNITVSGTVDGIDIAALNTAVAANTSKTGITSAQASAITANTAKTGISSAQTSAITANTAKTGISSAQTSAITANTAKTGITSSQASAITANTNKTGISTGQANAITANTNKTGITSAQTSAITANTAKTGISSAQTSAITANTAKTGITSSQASAITANTSKTGITSSQASAITANTSKTGITSAQASAITANTSKTGITSSQSSAITANTAKTGVTSGTQSFGGAKTFTTTPISVTRSTADSSTYLATTAFVKNQGYITSAGNQGTVTSVATTNGITGGTITGSGTIQLDSTVIRTTGNQTKSGNLTLSNNLAVNGNSLLGNATGDYVHVNDVLHVGAIDSGDSHLYFGEGSTGAVAYGVHWYWDSGYTFTWRTRNNNSDTIMMRYRTDVTSSVEWLRDFDMNNNQIKELASPSAGTDATTKDYVDNSIGRGSLSMTTSTGLNGSATFSANSSSNQTFAVTMDLDELNDIDGDSDIIDFFIAVDESDDSVKIGRDDMKNVDAHWKHTPFVLNSNFLEQTNTSSYINVPFNNTNDSTSSEYYNFFGCPYPGRVKSMTLMHVDGNMSSSFTTQLRVKKNGATAYTSGELTPSNGTNDGSYVQQDDIHTSFVKGDRLQFALGKSISSRYWQGATMTIVLEFLQYNS